VLAPDSPILEINASYDLLVVWTAGCKMVACAAFGATPGIGHREHAFGVEYLLRRVLLCRREDAVKFVAVFRVLPAIVARHSYAPTHTNPYTATLTIW